MIRRFLARVVLVLTGLPFCFGVAIALFLDEEVGKRWLDNLAAARPQLDRPPTVAELAVMAARAESTGRQIDERQHDQKKADELRERWRRS